MPAAITEARDTRAWRERTVRGLYAVTPDTVDTSWLVDAVQAAVRGGARVVQYRNKTADARLRSVQAKALARAVAGSDAILIVNDDVQIAAEAQAHGVHLGEDDAALAEARKALGKHELIGVSCYNDFSRARALVEQGADYVAFGSFFPSRIKPDARRADLACLREARTLDVAVVAIGGITADNARILAREGAHAVAVISAVFDQREPAEIERAARAIAAVFADPF